ncbi:MAG: prenyltransferase [Intrasporangiaceae bacterium]|nr:prenyltransferase [Intrasporangiaceae bacterium]
MPLAALRQTGAFIAGQQYPNGQIPWFQGHFADPWDHVEAAMALGVVGRTEESRAAIDWLAATQRADGSWPMETVHDGLAGTDAVTEATADSNQCSYVAVGLWHDFLVTGDRRHLERHWDMLDRAIELVVAAQLPSGAISWGMSPMGEWVDEALLTGSSCIVLSLAAALAIADTLGHDRPHWALARDLLIDAVQEGATVPQPGNCQVVARFLDKSRYSMDWYYPVLGGAVTGEAGDRLIDSRWEDFIVPGYGIRCVDDRPWATPAESCELVIALDMLGRRDEALRILGDVEMHRDDDGGYWTGYVWPDEAIWPEEKTTWTAAAVVLAHDAVFSVTPASGMFRSLAGAAHTPSARIR